MHSLKLVAILLPLGRMAVGGPVFNSPQILTGDVPALPPNPNNEPLVIPGPGMPSLDSLGLTSANLFDENFMTSYFANQTTKRSDGSERDIYGGARVEKRFPDQCINYKARASVQGAVACANYLQALGETSCTAPPEGITMCYSTAGSSGITSYVSGHSVESTPQTSWCKHVAEAVWWGRNHCVFCPELSDCIFSSLAAAYGNGDLIIATWGTANWT
jgi:hypothetical protein